MKIQVKEGYYFNKKYLNLERFISYYYQIDLIRQTLDSGRILFIGPGDGLVVDYLSKNNKYIVETYDIDDSLNPDIVGDIRNIDLEESSYDLVVAFEVLEHIEYENFAPVLEKLKKISKGNVMISIPNRVSSFEFIFKFPFVRSLFKRNNVGGSLDIPLRFPGFEKSGQHYWEVDIWKYRIRKVRSDIRKHFKIVKEKHPILNRYHIFFFFF